MPSSGDLSFEIKVGFFRHVKTLRLRARCGLEGCWALLSLWAYAAQGFTDGVLHGHSPGEVEVVSGWAGEPGAFHAALVGIGWLEMDGITLHDWHDEQPYVVSRPDRMARARAAGIASGQARRSNSELNPQLNVGLNRGLNPGLNQNAILVEPSGRPGDRTTVSEEAPPPPKGSGRKVGPQEALARDLAKRLGSSVNTCRQQVQALVGAGWDLERIRAAVVAHAVPGVSPWEWTKTASGNGSTRRGMTGAEILAWGKNHPENGEA